MVWFEMGGEGWDLPHTHLPGPLLGENTAEWLITTWSQYLTGKGGTSHLDPDPSVILVRSQRSEGRFSWVSSPSSILALRSSSIEGVLLAAALPDLAQ